jgi:hypothetical protein
MAQMAQATRAFQSAGRSGGKRAMNAPNAPWAGSVAPNDSETTDARPYLVAELNAQFAESAKLEQTINVSCEALAKKEANLKGLGYGG